MFQITSGECKVSNAVPWSQVNDSGNNANPSKDLARLAVPFWGELLPVIAPKIVLACGRVTRRVMEGVGSRFDAPWEIYFLCHLSTQATVTHPSA
jgi:hypothetical protein